MNIYYKIVEDFGFSVEKDIESAKILNDLVENLKNTISLEKVKRIIKDKDVYILGAGPSIFKHRYRIKNPNVVADGACRALLEIGKVPDIIVSDLDGDIEALLECNKKGSVIFVHAHGDNIEKIKKIVPKLKNVVPTHQVPNLKLENLYYFGGFTDGDRACYISYHLGAKKLILGGMDFGDKISKYSRNINKDIDFADKFKKKKLYYAKYLIELLSKKIDIEFLE
ncbi:6-hydroxymethylpterin diphosphokinase MptE-like protein [Methanocaldococcus indicus]|uniref:6-hydroxymethylpterin diphosphokinase MptE-like protein n=1 Tax=Methanocaldococcus indicus TaxID=213231 RepID=UPI003C6CC823